MKTVSIYSIILLVLLSTIDAHCQKSNGNGIMVAVSPYTVDTTLKMLKSRIVENGLSILSEIDHTEEAGKVGFDLEPCHLLVFGNPWVDTQLMNCDPMVGIALPLKILVWKGEDGTKVGYYDPTSMLQSFDLKNCDNILRTIKNAMPNIVNFDAY